MRLLFLCLPPFPSLVQSSPVGGASGQAKTLFRQILATGVSCSIPSGMRNPLLPLHAAVPIASGISQGFPVDSSSGLRSAVLAERAVPSSSGPRLSSPAFSVAVTQASFYLFHSLSFIFFRPSTAVSFAHPPPRFNNVGLAILTRLPLGNNGESAPGFFYRFSLLFPTGPTMRIQLRVPN